MLYISNVNISSVNRVVGDPVLPEVRVAGSQSTGSVYSKAMNWKCTVKICVHKFVCKIVTQKIKRKRKAEPKIQLMLLCA